MSHEKVTARQRQTQNQKKSGFWHAKWRKSLTFVWNQWDSFTKSSIFQKIQKICFDLISKTIHNQEIVLHTLHIQTISCAQKFWKNRNFYFLIVFDHVLVDTPLIIPMHFLFWLKKIRKCKKYVIQNHRKNKNFNFFKIFAHRK